MRRWMQCMRCMRWMRDGHRVLVAPPQGMGGGAAGGIGGAGGGGVGSSTERGRPQAATGRQSHLIQVHHCLERPPPCRRQQATALVKPERESRLGLDIELASEGVVVVCEVDPGSPRPQWPAGRRPLTRGWRPARDDDGRGSLVARWCGWPHFDHCLPGTSRRRRSIVAPIDALPSGPAPPRRQPRPSVAPAAVNAAACSADASAHALS